MIISDVDKAYEFSEKIIKRSPVVHYVSSPEIEKLYSLSFLLYKDIQERQLTDVWNKFSLYMYKYLKNLRYPISPKVLYEEITLKEFKSIEKEMVKSIKKIDKIFESKVYECTDAIKNIAEKNDEIILNKVMQNCSGKEDICIIDSPIISLFEDRFRVSFKRTSQVKNTFMSGNIFIFDTLDELNERNKSHLITSPVTPQVNLVLYDFDDPGELNFTKINNAGASSIKILKSGRSENFKKYNFNKVRDLSDTIDYEKVNHGLYKDKKVETTPCIVGDDSVIFIESSVKHTIAQIQGEDATCVDVVKTNTHQLEEGSLLIITSSGGGDQIVPIANDLIGPDHILFRELQATWKSGLKALISKIGTAKLAKRLTTLGAARSCEVNVRNWASDYTLGPESEEDLKAIIKVCDTVRPYNDFLNAIKELRRAHTRAGHKIHKILGQKIRGSSLKKVYVQNTLKIADPKSDAEKIILLITKIEKKRKINRSLCNRVFKISDII